MNQIYAGFWRRLAAIVVDCLVLVIPGLAIDAAIGQHVLVATLVKIAVAVAYFAGMHSSKLQATLGKMAFGIKVTDLEGKRIGVPLAIGRYFATWLSAIVLGIGFVIAGFTKKRQALHDIVCKTLVVDKNTDPLHIAEGNDVMDVTWPVWLVSGLLFLGSVVGIVAAVTIPAVRAAETRDQIAQTVVEVNQIKKEVAEAAVTRQPLKVGSRQPASGMARGIVQSIDVQANGQITVIFKPGPLDGGKAIMAPLALRGSATEWRCWSEGVPTKYMAAICPYN
jgi:uncharacterized RDD family membrane protein YckC